MRKAFEGLRHWKAGRTARHPVLIATSRQLDLTVSTTLYRDVLNTRGRHGVYVSPLSILRRSKLNVISTSVPSLYLDPQIRDWVLFPITLVMVCFFIRHYARTYMLGDLRYS